MCVVQVSASPCLCVPRWQEHRQGISEDSCRKCEQVLLQASDVHTQILRGMLTCDATNPVVSDWPGQAGTAGLI